MPPRCLINCLRECVPIIIVFFGWQGDDLKVKVKRLTSTKTQLPISYYSLPFCRPEKIEDGAENLGEILLGDRSENSPYVVAFISIFRTILRLFQF